MAARLDTKVAKFLQTLEVPEGKLAGRKVKLAPFQRQFLRGLYLPDTTAAVFSVARGGAKTMLAAGVALAHLLGVDDRQPRREAILVARSRDQARILWRYVQALAASLPEETQARITFRRGAVLEIELAGEGIIRVIAADPKNALGLSPTLIVMDERASWPADKGAELEASLLTASGKRPCRTIILSTSAPDDANAFSRWLDEDVPGAYRQEHRAPIGLPPDDLPSLRLANPGTRYGVGPSEEWLLASARRAMKRGGSALASFRNLNRNERCAAEARDSLVTVDQWQAIETEALPPRDGPVVLGVDLGGSVSMSAWAAFWPHTKRLEVGGAFATNPNLSDRGAADGVGSRYREMEARGELETLGDRVVPAGEWIARILKRLDGQPVAAVTLDRYRQAEALEALEKAGSRVPIVWRGQGWKDGAEDVERFRAAVVAGEVRCAPSLLMRSALADAVCVADVAGNAKLAKGRSTGRIDAAAAAVLAVAEGARLMARTDRPKRAAVWL